jgi:hypothetical protein
MTKFKDEHGNNLPSGEVIKRSLAALDARLGKKADHERNVPETLEAETCNRLLEASGYQPPAGDQAFKNDRDLLDALPTLSLPQLYRFLRLLVKELTPSSEFLSKHETMLCIAYLLAGVFHDGETEAYYAGKAWEEIKEYYQKWYWSQK